MNHESFHGYDQEGSRKGSESLLMVVWAKVLTSHGDFQKDLFGSVPVKVSMAWSVPYSSSPAGAKR